MIGIHLVGDFAFHICYWTLGTGIRIGLEGWANGSVGLNGLAGL
jgi:hypothetical protein